MNTPFEITKEEVLNLAAQKLVDAYGGDPDISERAEEIAREKVEELFSKTCIAEKIDAALTAELDKLLGQEIYPVDIWGEREGTQPTTIRAQLAERAKNFWETKVDAEGRGYSYGTPRCEMLMKKILNEEFAQSIKNHADVIVAEFKKALVADSSKMVAEYIDRLINVRTR